jgi:fructokinase
MKQYDILCIGEILVDLISREPGKTLSESGVFSRFPGGAPANVAVGLAKLGQAVNFTGRVGDDSFGCFLKKNLEADGVGTSALVTDKERQTRLAFVSIDEQGERSFEFFVKNPADLALAAADINAMTLKRLKVVHFGSLALTDKNSRREFFRIVSQIPSDTLISFDPNYRSSLWRSETEAYETLNSFASKAHILKLDIEEAKFLYHSDSLDDVLGIMAFDTTQIVAITLGQNGCILKTRNFHVQVPGFTVDVADTTGCGDAFMAALIDGILVYDKKPQDLSISKLSIIGRRANAAGALTALQFGARSGLPTRSELDEFLLTVTDEKVNE